jgi:hypothetical protein
MMNFFGQDVWLFRVVLWDFRVLVKVRAKHFNDF